MSIINSCSLLVRLKRELPPSGPFPATLQTLAGWYLPYAYPEYCHAHLGDRFTVYPLHMPPLVFLADPQDIRAVITAPSTDLHPGAGAHVLAPLIGDRAFMLLEEDAHIYGRKAITPAFHQNMVRDQTAMLNEMVACEIATWPTETVLAIHPRIRALTLRVILRAIFSDTDAALGALHERLMAMLSVSGSLMLQEPKLRHLPGWRATWRSFARQRGEVEGLIYGLMNRRRTESCSEAGDLLDMLLGAESADGSPMPDRKIRDNLMAMIVAGHETTTGELTWAFQLLAHNPDVQDRLIEEIDSGRGEEYLTATVHETLRHKPVFLFAIPREVVQPVEIGGWTYRPLESISRHAPTSCTTTPSSTPSRTGSAPSASSARRSSRAPGCRGEEDASTASGGTSPCWRFRASCGRCSPAGACSPRAIASSPPGGAAQSWSLAPEVASSCASVLTDPRNCSERRRRLTRRRRAASQASRSRITTLLSGEQILVLLTLHASRCARVYIRVDSGGQLRAMCAEILSEDRAHPLVGLTCRAGARDPALPVDRVCEIVGEGIPVYVIEPAQARASKTLLPDRHAVFGGAARVWWPGVSEGSDPFHPVIFDATGVYGEDALERLAREFRVQSPQPVGLSPQQQAVLQERLRTRAERRCRELEAQLASLQRRYGDLDQRERAAGSR